MSTVISIYFREEEALLVSREWAGGVGQGLYKQV